MVASIAVASTATLSVKEARLGDGGVATLTVVAESAQLSFRSAAIGIDCHGRQLTCCYFWDEVVDGTLFHPTRERVAVWIRRDTWLEFYIFGTRDGLTEASYLHRFRAACGPAEALRRIAWTGLNVVVWVGSEAAEEIWRAQLLRVHGAAASGAPVASGGTDATSGASSWENAEPIDPAQTIDLNSCEVSASGRWLIARHRASAGGGAGGGAAQLRAFRLPIGPETRPVELRGAVAACFAEQLTATRAADLYCDYYALQCEGGECTLLRGTLVAGRSQPSTQVWSCAPWLRDLSLPAATEEAARLCV